jgi:DNA adenine methylase
MNKRKKLIAFQYYGGKFLHLSWLLPLLPPCRHFCEPFGGSAAVMLNRKPSPLETYNDLDGDAVNFFHVLRNQKTQLIRSLSLTPWSRGEFSLACEFAKNISSLERARRFFVRSRQAYGGQGSTAKIGHWRKYITKSSRGVSAGISAWLNGIDGLSDVAERLLSVQLDNRSAVCVIEVYDSPKTLFYCDPPYSFASRTKKSKKYAHEMTDEQHESLASTLNCIEGMAAVSGYDCKFMDSLYPVPLWIKTVGPRKKSPAAKGTRQEVLWTNYDPKQFTKGENDDE